jgi:pterin-4a-carbinolamine dehydratase
MQYNKPLTSFMPKRAPMRTPAAARGILPLHESAGELPIKTPRDNWETVTVRGVTYIERSFKLKPAETKMLVCDILDAQEEFDHAVDISMSGGVVTVRSTTHEHGEPTERDREIARYIDTTYDEVRGAYR